MSRLDFPRPHAVLPGRVRSCRLADRVGGVVVGAGAVLILTGFLVLLGWALARGLLRTVAPAMTVGAGAAAIVTGVALLLLDRPPTARVCVTIARLCAISVGLLGAAGIARHLFSAQGFGAVPFGKTTFAGQPSLLLAGALVLICGALLAASDDRARLGRGYPALVGALGIVVLGGAIGCAYSTEALGRVSPATGLAPETLPMLAAAWTGLTWLRPERGLPAILKGDRPGAILARKLGPVAILGPFILRLVRLAGEELGLYGVTTGVTLGTLAMTLTFVAILHRTGGALDATDARRREAEMRFRKLVESAPDAIVIVDHLGRVAQVNARVETLSGYHRTEMVGREVEMLIPERHRAAHLDYRNRFASSPLPRPMGGGLDLHMLCKNGRELPVEISLSPLHPEQGAPVSVTIRDVSEQRRAQEALRDSDRLKTTLLRSAAHDFRSPLTAIATAAEAIALPGLGLATRRELQEIIVGEAGRLSRLVSKLLDLSRLQGGSAAPHQLGCSIEAILSSALEHINADGDAFTLVVDEELPDLWVDPVQVERAFANLLENGRRFANSAPVEVRAEAKDGRLVVRVADDGPGIPASKREKIFEPFFRIADSGRPGGGSGLGLAIAKGFLEANGGSIFLEPRPPGHGSTFVVELPVDCTTTPSGVRP